MVLLFAVCIATIQTRDCKVLNKDTMKNKHTYKYTHADKPE